jgi:hypothetical protein
LSLGIHCNGLLAFFVTRYYDRRMARQNLLNLTYQLLDDSTLKYREIASGSGVDINWLAKFKQRAIAEPGVTKVQAVYDFLRSKRIPRSRNHAA